MTAIELFQLTRIAASMLASGNPAVRALARLLGTEFSTADLLAYAVGIGCLAAMDRAREIEAAVPKHVEDGRLRAIRRLLPFGRSQ